MPSPRLFQKLIDAIEDTLKAYELNDRTGPTIRETGQSKTLAYNLFLEEHQKLLKSLRIAVD
ncbi:MAG: hypothetical protein ACFFB3_21300, partial [Candidatus Hodarchaeota archaeon]